MHERHATGVTSSEDVEASAPAAPAESQHWHLYDREVKRAAPVVLTATALCPACRSTQVRARYTLQGLSWQVVDCRQCGTGRLEPPPTSAEVIDFYPADYYGSTGAKFRGVIEQVVRLVAARQARFLIRGLPPGARILDVGCGRGTLLSTFAEAGFEAHGTELTEDAPRGVDRRAQITICPSLNAAGYPQDYFDEVVLWHVLEHLPNPRETITEARRILRPGGRLVISVPNYSSWQSRLMGAAWFHLDPPRHLFHFTLNGLRQMLTECGLDVTAEHHFSLRQNPFGWIQSLMNLFLLGPRNGLYCLLQHAQPSPVSVAWAWGLKGVAFVLLPPAILMSVLAALFRSGATVHVVSRPNEPGP